MIITTVVGDYGKSTTVMVTMANDNNNRNGDYCKMTTTTVMVITGKDNNNRNGDCAI